MLKKWFLCVALAALIFTTSCLRPLDNGMNTGTDSEAFKDSLVSDTVADDTTADAVTDNTVYEAKKASFVGCGDNILYYGTWRDAKYQAKGTREYDFKPIYKNVQGMISSADIAFINQETVCAQSFDLASYPQFNSPVDLTYDIQEVGFDVVSLANNHMLDKGALGLRESFDNWNERGVHVIGAYEEKDTGRYITYYEKNGITIAFVAYTYGTNLAEDPAKKGLYAPYLKQSDVAGDVREAYENSDFVIVSVHWGDEGSFSPSDEQKRYADIMAKNGADVIIGHHPHVLQPVEWLEGIDGGKTLCAYSLGNFVHEQEWDYNVPGGILTFDIVKDGPERARVESPLLVPTVCHYPRSFYNNTVYFLEDYTEKLASEHAVNTYYGHKLTLGGLKKYVTDTITAEFLPESFK